MSVYVYGRDRSELGMVETIIDKLIACKIYEPSWRKARIVLIPGDRREAVRFAMDAFEAGKEIWHLGAGDSCEGDAAHYDGKYRWIISELSAESKGKLLALRDDALAYPGCDDINFVGPTMQESMPPKEKLARHHIFRYSLLCWNWDGWNPQEPPRAPATYAFAMNPGNDGPRKKVTRDIEDAGWKILPRMIRPRFLSWLAHADAVFGNSSLLTYEAPVYHPDSNIHHCGRRNAGRGIAKFDVKKYGSPSDNVMKLIEREFKKDAH